MKKIWKANDMLTGSMLIMGKRNPCKVKVGDEGSQIALLAILAICSIVFPVSFLNCFTVFS